MKLNFLTTLAFSAAVSLNLNAQNLKVQPEFWYSGFKNPEVQVLIYGENISRSKATITAANCQPAESSKPELSVSESQSRKPGKV